MVKYSMMRNSLMTSFFSWSKCWIFRIMPLQWLYNKSKPNAVLMIQSLFYWIFNFNPTQLPNKHLFWLLLSSRTVMAWGCFDVQQSKVQSPNPLGILWDDWTIILEIQTPLKFTSAQIWYIYIYYCVCNTLDYSVSIDCIRIVVVHSTAQENPKVAGSGSIFFAQKPSPQWRPVMLHPVVRMSWKTNSSPIHLRWKSRTLGYKGKL